MVNLVLQKKWVQRERIAERNSLHRVGRLPQIDLLPAETKATHSLENIPARNDDAIMMEPNTLLDNAGISTKFSLVAV